MGDSAVIKFHNVRYCYGEVCAVSGVDFSLPENKMTVLVGPNGGGKSTLLKLITGILKPEEGSVQYIKDTEVGYVPQNFSFDTSFPLTVMNLVLQGTLSKKVRPFGRYTSVQNEKAKEVIFRAGLSGFENRSIKQLSGGQLKRAVIARILASDVNLIALDEPEAGLDVDAARELFDMLGQLKSEKTIVTASHNIDTILDRADKAIYVNKTAKEYDSPSVLKNTLKGGILL